MNPVTRTKWRIILFEVLCEIMNCSAPEGESSSSGTQKGLTKKRQIRGGHRAYVTGILNTVKETLKSYETADEIKIKQHKLT